MPPVNAYGERRKSGLVGTSTPTTALELWVLELVLFVQGRRVTTTNTPWDYDTYLALAQVVMLPQDVVS